MNPYFIYRKCLLLLVAYGGVTATSLIFPKPLAWTLSNLIGEFIFSPYKLLGASLTFIVGFLGYSLFVQDAFRYMYEIKRDKVSLLFIFLAGLSWIHLVMKGWVIALLTLVLALFYGIMDVNLGKREK